MQIMTPRNYLPRTGQTTSYSDGDDGDLQAGNPRATRFVDVGNGTVTDRATGLTWVKQPELIIPGETGIHASNQIQAARGDWADATTYALADLVGDTTDDKFYVCVHAHTSDQGSGVDTDAPNTGTEYWRETVWTRGAANLTSPAYTPWADAVSDCLVLDYAGCADWRLPNVLELMSLVDFESGGLRAWWPPSAVSAARYLWTSTTVIGSPAYAYLVRPNITVPLAKSEKVAANLYHVCPVRGGRTNG